MIGFYLNEKALEELPCEALALMSERLSAAISLYFSAHPDEYGKLIGIGNAENTSTISK